MFDSVPFKKWPAFFLILIPFFVLAGQNQSENTSKTRLESWKNQARLTEDSPFKNMSWSSLGPCFQGGRVETIEAVPGTSTIFAGFGAGSLWKTDNNGLTWVNIFGRQPTFTIGDLAVSPSHEDIIYVGTGENLLARSSFAGLGVFKSTDGGTTWAHVGLEDTHHIGRVVIHPENPDIVYVAALGHEYSPNEERGLFRTRDGGKSWKKILYFSDRTGVADVAINPADPDVLYASSLEHGRQAWNNYESNGALFKTVDGGETWVQLANGLPSGKDVGRIALAVAPSRPSTVYVFLVNQSRIKKKDKEAKRPAAIGPEVYRSENSGAIWKKLPMASERFSLHSYADIRVSPDNPDVIYTLGVNLLYSEDGGLTCRQMEGTIHHLLSHPARALHLDQHDLWIDPTNPDRLILGNDGGIYISNDRGENWIHCNTIPVGEFYAVSVDNGDPYYIYGGTQDNAALLGPSDRLPESGLDDPWRYVWIDLWGGGDSFITQVDPGDPDIIYFEQQFGNFQRKNLRTGEIARIRPRIRDSDTPLRYNWMSPFIISPHNPLTLYFGANRLFRSLNRGQSWQVISPDLTSIPKPEKQGNVPYGTITTLSESSLRPGLLFVGTDDGRVWKTDNNGITWTDIHKGLPDLWVSRVTASHHDEKTVFLSMTGYRQDDFMTYLYKSEDGGANWTSIKGNLPEEQFNVIREDPKYKNRIFAASDQGGVYISTDGGQSWLSLCADLSAAAVHDIAIQSREREMVIATHGLSIFKLDLLPVDEYTNEIKEKDGHLFPVRAARLPQSRDYGGDWAYETGKKAVIHYYLKNSSPEVLDILILDEKGKTVRRLNGMGESGINRLEWDLSPDGRPAAKGVYEQASPLVRPGIYRVEVRGKNILLTAEVRVKGPSQIKVGRAG